MDVTNTLKSQGNHGCTKYMSENTRDSVYVNTVASETAEKAGKCYSNVNPKATNLITNHNDNHCFYSDVLTSRQTPEDAKAREQSILNKPLAKNTLSDDQANIPIGKHNYFVEDASNNCDTKLHPYTNLITVDELSDNKLEYLECSDVMTAHENEIWEKKLQFLLESDDEEDIKRGEDCYGCDYFLSEMPHLFQVSDNTVPMDTTIGFCGHQSKSKEVAVRRDLSTYSQSTLRTGMTLTVGYHQDKTTTMKDKIKYMLPIASTAIENDCLRIEEENTTGNYSAANFPTDRSQDVDHVLADMEPASSGLGGSLTNQASKTMTANSLDGGMLNKSSQELDEVKRKRAEEKSKDVVLNLIERLRRDLLKLLNPKELCKYLTVTGESAQTVIGGMDSSVLFPGQEGVTSTQRPQEIDSLQIQTGLCPTEKADNNCPGDGEWSRTLSEKTQVPNESTSSSKQETNLKSLTQGYKEQSTKPEIDKRFNVMTSPTSDSAPASLPALETNSSENLLQTEHTTLQICTDLNAPHDMGHSKQQLPCWDQRINITSNNTASSSDISPCFLQDTSSVTNKQASACAVLAPTDICDEQRNRRKTSTANFHDSSNANTFYDELCDQYVFEADCQAVLESVKPECGGSDLLAVHDELLKLLCEEDSDYPFPYENKGVTSLEIRPAVVEASELHFTEAACTEHPVLVNMTEDNEPVIGLASELGTEKEDRSDSNGLLKTDEACSSTSIGKISLSQIVETDGICLCSSFGNKAEAPAIHSLTNDILNAEEGSELEANKTLTNVNGSIQISAAQKGKLSDDNSFQSCDTESPQRLMTAQSPHLERDQENPMYIMDDSISQLLCIEQNIHFINDSIAKCRNELSTEDTHDTHCHPARNEDTNPDFEQKDKFFRNASCENTSQFTREKHPSVTAGSKSSEENCHGKENESDQNTANDSNSDPSRDNDRKAFQAASDAQDCSHLMYLHSSVMSPESATSRDASENVAQVHKTAEISVEEKASTEDQFISEMFLEKSKDEENKMDKGKKDLGLDDKQKTVILAVPILNHISECQPSDSYYSASEGNATSFDQGFETWGELTMVSPVSNTCKSGNVAILSIIQPASIGNEYNSTANQDCKDTTDMVDNSILGTQQANLRETLTIKPRNQTEGPSVNTWAMACSSVENLVQPEPTQMKIKTEENFNKLETMSEPLQDQCHAIADENKDEAILCKKKTEQIQKVTDYSSDEVEVEPYMRALINADEEEHIRNYSPGQSHSDRTPSSQQFGASVNMPGIEYAIEATQHNKNEEFTAGESQNLIPSTCLTGGLVSPPICVSENTHHLQEQLLQSKSQQFTLPVTIDGSLTSREKRTKTQEGSKPCKVSQALAGPEDMKSKQKVICNGPLAEGAKKKMPSKKPRQEEKENVSKNSSCVKKVLKAEAGAVHREDRVETIKLPSRKDSKGSEEIEFVQLMFRDNLINDGYLGGNLHGKMATEELHFGEGMHRKAFRSKVMQGLVPVFSPGHPCVLKVHNTVIAYGAKSKDEIVQRNYKLAMQECDVQNTAREYAKIYAAEAEPLEGFGEVPEIIPIFLVHRPENNIPYATVEEELTGDFVKYSIKDGKEINFKRKDSEAGQKGCTFQHWLYEKTNGSLLVTDLQGVGMKLTDVGIATLAKGYKGFKGNCSISFIDQFKALHQCNKYCEMLGLKSLRAKQRKPTVMKSKVQSALPNAKKMVCSIHTTKKT
ncbi:alpha-protein kinase 2 isoform X1 [Alligator sinensis]|uniref:Alpha-protein kinase 2 isoform X1 n=2 Tax=Alligator sinensis TaxID=38654 RepID=A0A1U8CVY2_ALLSI|nr:alpha-protein kinase 2 isoform X1 [Alligator sinensis]XP_025054243.1 alpha-protein kinase 2 isoform X1 [Alligator sinensis]